MSAATELYEHDFHAWAQDQAALLRAWPEALRPNALDIANLAEEIEDLGASQRYAVQSLMFQIILHLLKLRHHPDQSFRRHWQEEIDAFRDTLARHLEASPSLHARREELAAKEWRRAARRFRQLLARQDLRFPGLTDEPGFDLDREVLAEDWFPEPAREG